ncbi:Cerato-platanin, partial [Russula aff. rugulosa BPL654]
VLATYDATYDNPSGSLNGVACSNGANGLVTNYATFGDLPTFPFIGGAPGVVWNSPYCGGCWKLTSTTTGESIIYTAIDSSSGFNIAQDAFVEINGGQIGQGTLEVAAEPVPRYLCGL